MSTAEDTARGQSSALDERYHHVNPYYKPTRASNQRGMFNLIWLLLLPGIVMYFFVACRVTFNDSISYELTYMAISAVILFFIAWFGIYIFKLRRGGQAAFAITAAVVIAFALRILITLGMFNAGEAPGIYGGQWIAEYDWGKWASTYSILLHPGKLIETVMNPAAHYDLSVYGKLAGSMQFIWILEFLVTLIVVLQATRQCNAMFVDDYGAWARRRRTRSKLRFVKLEEYREIKTGLENSDFSVIYDRPAAKGSDPENYSAVYTYRVRGVNTGYISVSNIHLRKYNEHGKYWAHRQTVVVPPIFISGGQADNLIKYLDARDRGAFGQVQLYAEASGKKPRPAATVSDAPRLPVWQSAERKPVDSQPDRLINRVENEQNIHEDNLPAAPSIGAADASPSDKMLTPPADDSANAVPKDSSAESGE